MARERGRVQSVARAITVLEALADGQGAPHGNGIVEISKRCQLPVSTVHRLLATLVDAHLVAQDPETGRYRVGVRAFEIGNAFLDQTDLRTIAHRHMRTLAERTEETVNLAIRDDQDAVYIDQVESPRMLKLFTRPGARAPLVCSGVGKVLLSGLSDDEVARFVQSVPIPTRTFKTISNPITLSETIRVARERGYALDDEEVELGVRCVAAPIHNHRREIHAALSLSGPTSRISDQRLDELIRLVRATADTISIELGRDHRV